MCMANMVRFKFILGCILLCLKLVICEGPKCARQIWCGLSLSSDLFSFVLYDNEFLK